jgi:nucleotide-binding universal stress UspA family protein
MTLKRKILAAIDFSKTSDRALRQSHSLAKALGKDLVLLHVIEEHGGLFHLFTPEQKQIAEEQITEQIETLRQRAIKFSGQSVDTMVLHGKPYLKIIEEAERMDAAMIVMGVRGDISHSAEKQYIGNNASKVARSAPCPVVTICDKVTCHNLRNILLPLDITRETRQKVTNAVELAKKFGAGIKVVSAMTTKGDATANQKQNIIINQVLSFIEEDGIACSGEIIYPTKDAKREVPMILKYAEEQGDIDMILIMTQPELGVLDFFISSNAQEMLRKSPFPVMSVQPKNLERTSVFSF